MDKATRKKRFRIFLFVVVVVAALAVAFRPRTAHADNSWLAQMPLIMFLTPIATINEQGTELWCTTAGTGELQATRLNKSALFSNADAIYRDNLTVARIVDDVQMPTTEDDLHRCRLEVAKKAVVGGICYSCHN